MRRKPWLWLLAGPNGAGKSTHAPELRARVEEIVGPDEVAYRVARDAPQSAAFRAGRIALRRRNELLQERRSFAIETTISGHGHLPVIKRTKQDGWGIGVVYIGLSTADLAIERVRQRVRQGGHDVPPEDVRRRYERSLQNLADVCDIADRLIVFDNSSARLPMRRVLELNHGRVLFAQRRIPRWLGTTLRGKLPARSKTRRR